MFFVFFCFTLKYVHNTNFMNRLKLIDCTNFTIFKMTPISTHGKLTKERLVNLVVRRGECFVGLSILLVYGLGAPRLPAVCGGRTPGQDQEAGQVQQVDVHPHRQEHNSNYILRFTKQSWALASFYCVTCVRSKFYSMSAHCQEQ